MPEAFVLVGPHVRLDRPGLSVQPPGTVARLLELCQTWAQEVGWSLTADLRSADAVVVGPAVAHPPLEVPVAEVRPGQGVDGFRWALRHLAFTREWPPETVAYGRSPEQVADVRRPERGDGGVAVLLHGGFWMSAWRRDVMDGLAVDLARRGWTTVNAEYRRVGAGGSWPLPGRDALAVLDLVDRIAGASGRRLLVGHSAGAQLALWAAGERPEHTTQVIALAGLCDLVAAERNRVGGDAVERLLDGEPAAAASPLERLPVGVPLVLAHASADPVVPADQSRRYATAAAAAGDDVRLIEVAGGDHLGLIEPAGAWAEVAPAAVAPG